MIIQKRRASIFGALSLFLCTHCGEGSDDVAETEVGSTDEVSLETDVTGTTTVTGGETEGDQTSGGDDDDDDQPPVSRCGDPAKISACVDGMAGTYPCDGIDLLSNTTNDQLGGAESSIDIWGWADPDSGREFVVQSRYDGTSYVEITDPCSPKYLGMLPSSGGSSVWHDVKVYDHYALSVNESGGHGMQIFDLHHLLALEEDQARVFEADAVYRGFGNAHNIALSFGSPHVYAIGTSGCSAGLNGVDLTDPLNPTQGPCMSSLGRLHDAHCVIYQGPDQEHQGKEICMVATDARLSVGIVDMSSSDQGEVLAEIGYTDFAAYSHQGWLTEDHAYYIHNDELDEMYNGTKTRSFVLDVRDLDNPQQLATVSHDNGTTDHNHYVHDGKLYAAWYTNGVWVFDLANIASGQLDRVGYFDNMPDNEDTGWRVGIWSTYPFFPSGVIAASDQQQGLFLLQLQQ